MSAAVEKRRRKARQLRARSPQPSIREIAEILDVSVGTAHRDVNPTAAERYRRAAREYKQRSRDERQG